jgi:hypothetical protein
MVRSPFVYVTFALWKMFDRFSVHMVWLLAETELQAAVCYCRDLGVESCA